MTVTGKYIDQVPFGQPNQIFPLQMGQCDGFILGGHMLVWSQAKSKLSQKYIEQSPLTHAVGNGLQLWNLLFHIIDYYIYACHMHLCEPLPPRHIAK